MPKLLQINITANWGSTGKIAESIGVCAKAKGWESYIAYGLQYNPSQSQLFPIASQWDRYVHYLGNRLFDREGLASSAQTRKLIRHIEQIQPDIIQLHNIHDHWLNYEILFNYLNTTNIKVVWTFHDCWAFTGHCYHFIKTNCVKWQTECGNCPQRNRFIDRSQENFRLKKSLFSAHPNLSIVACSNWLGDFVKQSFFKDKRIEVIHNGIDLKIFNPNGQKPNDGKFRIIAVSNVWLPYKGINDILKLRDMLDADYLITIVGLSAKQVKNLPSGIRGIQKTQNVQELVALYSEADVLINPSYADTFPTVNLEALACGTPVITYKTGGSPEAIDEQTGIVVEQGDVHGLVRAINTLRDNPLSEDDCRQRAITFFDKDKCFEQYIYLYEELLKTACLM